MKKPVFEGVATALVTPFKMVRSIFQHYKS